MPTAVIFVWGHQLNAVVDCGFAIGRPLEVLGYEVVYVNTSSVDNIKAALIPRLLECDLAISVGAIPLSFRINDSWLFEAFGKKFLYWVLDPIYYDAYRVDGVLQYLQMSRSSPRLWFASPDKPMTGTLNEFSPGKTFFFPFAGFFKPLLPVRGGIDRTVVVGTIGSELGDIPATMSLIDILASGHHLFDQDFSLEEAAHVIEARGGKLDILSVAKDQFKVPIDKLLTWEVCQHLSRIDSHQKRRRRVLALEALKEQPLDFYGTGWEAYRDLFRDARFLGTIPHEEMGNVFQNYMALLNFDTNFDHGLHLRAYTALGQGCKVLNNNSGSLDDLSDASRNNVFAYDGNNPNFDGIDGFLDSPAMNEEELLRFRRDNSWLFRTDRLLLELNTPSA